MGKRNKNGPIRIRRGRVIGFIASVIVVAATLFFIANNSKGTSFNLKEYARINYAMSLAINRPVKIILLDNLVEAQNKIITKQLEEKKKELLVKEAERLKSLQGKALDSSGQKKIAYLTFDDGPSVKTTKRVLDVLDRYDIKATFFVVGIYVDRNPDVIKDVYSRGHYIALHSYTHKYKQIYASMDSFLNDMDKLYASLKKHLGDDFTTKIMRFPGGSFEKYKQKYKTAMHERGFAVYDWNALNGDSEPGAPFSKEHLVKKFKETAGNKPKLIILMHDTDVNATTADALPEIIDYLIAKGYVFELLPV